MTRLARWRCQRRGHKWFPAIGPHEFIVDHDYCLRCKTHRVTLPWGQCLGDHPIAEHYDALGRLVAHPDCGGPS